MLLLWSDTEQEILNTATWANGGDGLILLTVWKKFQIYVRPQNISREHIFFIDLDIQHLYSKYLLWDKLVLCDMAYTSQRQYW